MHAPEVAAQLTSTHQENAVTVVTIVLGCAVAPNSRSFLPALGLLAGAKESLFLAAETATETTIGTTLSIAGLAVGASATLIDSATNAIIADGTYRDNVPGPDGTYIPRSSSLTSAGRPALGTSTTQLVSGDILYRVYGGGSGRLGRSMSTIDPRVAKFLGVSFRSLAGLPNWNTGERIATYVLLNDKDTIRRPALPFHGNPGGWPEIFFSGKNFASQVRIIDDRPFGPLPYRVENEGFPDTLPK